MKGEMLMEGEGKMRMEDVRMEPQSLKEPLSLNGRQSANGFTIFTNREVKPNNKGEDEGISKGRR